MCEQSVRVEKSAKKNNRAWTIIWEKRVDLIPILVHALSQEIVISMWFFYTFSQQSQQAPNTHHHLVRTDKFHTRNIMCLLLIFTYHIDMARYFEQTYLILHGMIMEAKREQKSYSLC